MRDELVDIVNGKDEVVGTAMKKAAYADKKTIRIGHAFIFNAEGDMALQLRSRNVSFCPGHWVTAGSGHVLAGESYLQAGRRELREELGISVPLTFEGAEHYVQPDGMEKFLGVLRGTYDGVFSMHPDDVDDVKWFSMNEIQNMVARGERFHPEFLFLLTKRFGIREIIHSKIA